MTLKYHMKLRGKISICLKDSLTKETLTKAYTPGVAEASIEIARDPEKAYLLTNKWNNVAVLSDGTRVLGLGNIGAMAAIPVMEGKAMLFKELGNVDAFPICVKEREVDKIVDIAKAIEPVFGGINLEDIENPKCFELEKRLIEELDIPVFHDDQHGTAIVVLAGLINSFKLVEKKKEDVRVVVNGVGSAGTAIIKLLVKYGIKNIIAVDSKGILDTTRNDLNDHKKGICEITNREGITGTLRDAVRGSDVLIGVSTANAFDVDMLRQMNSDGIVFALANPIPEILPSKALTNKVRVVATGRSDYPNQINNILAFPGVFRGALDVRAKKITDEMKVAAAEGIAKCVEEPSEQKIVPDGLDKRVAYWVGRAVALKALEQNMAREKLSKKEVEEIIKQNLKMDKL